jgi:MFS family permease
MCSFQLLMGKVYKYYPAKPIFLVGTIVFEVGSAVCGAAPTSKVFIVGRAIAGLGSSGMFSGAMVIMFHTVPLQQRPIYQGLGGAVFAVGSVVGPLLGGLFTDKLTWRWCFYINLPVGAVTIVVIFLILHLPNQKLDEQASGWIAKIKQLDPIGTLVFFPGVLCLILALQWGGTTYSWKNARIVVLLVLCVVLCLAFAGIQIWKQEGATIPPRLFKQRSIAAAVWFSFFHGSSMIVILYYLPIWFQAIKNVTAVRSGIMLLPLVLSTVFGSLSSGILVSNLGYYTPFFILSSVAMSIGAGLLSTFTPTTGHAQWIGYQVLFGIGIGFGIQQPLNAAQTILDRSDIATGSAIIMFFRFIGTAIFLPVAQNLFLSRLISKLDNLPDISPQAVTDGGATSLRHLASGNDLNTLLSDYDSAIVDVFYIAVAMAALTVFGSLLVEWRSLKATAAKQAGKSIEPKEPVSVVESV